jgi:hypothetical protein
MKATPFLTASNVPLEYSMLKVRMLVFRGLAFTYIGRETRTNKIYLKTLAYEHNLKQPIQ